MIAFVDTVNMGKNGLQLDEFKIFHQNTRPQGSWQIHAVGKAFRFSEGTRELVAYGRIDGTKCRTFV